MKAVFLDFATLGTDINAAPLADSVDELAIFDASTASELLQRCLDCDAVFTNKGRFDATVIGALPKLRYIGLTATGSDAIDLAAARRAGIAVTNITAYCTQSVAQHVFAVLLSLTHKLAGYQHDVQSGKWQKQASFCILDHPIRELSGLTLGIVGYGELGRAVARLGRAFGMRIAVAKNHPGDDREGRIALCDLLAVADVVSLHCPLNARTRHLIDAESLSRMKRDAVLINTARGALVDTAALAQALRERRIAGAAVDVLSEEPPVNGDPLLDVRLDNLILTPHIAWAAREARQRAIDQTAENMREFRRGARRNRIDLTNGLPT